MTRILITGAGGNVGRALLTGLGAHEVLATDLAPIAQANFQRLDVTGDDADRVIGTFRPEVVIHLASIVTPPNGSTRAFEWRVDVQGSRNVLQACVAHDVRRLIVTSSGAAYGYHADNPVPLVESDPLRGNVEFPYADHKRQVEEMLAEARQAHPALEQVILRVGTVLGAGIENQITALFHKKRLLRVAGADSPFVFIWSKDLERILIRAATDGPAGIYNVAGDGAMNVTQLAQAMGKPVLTLPAWALRGALGIARPLAISRYGPEQVGFLQYRPVLDNTALKERFGYVPELTSAQVFDLWRKWAQP
ncbi:SDR family oxidoreductase [Pararhodobacter oceanensis]|uniref:SDR family oxidoreductase n=1 Tax=Pararhodobacter oceanensis TaxID=2172121 RepID=UPI003A8DBF64